MNVHDLVDDLYEAFADRLNGSLADRARELPHALRLAPEPVAWSRVFSHEVTLGAPAFVAEAMPAVSGDLVRDAVLAHMLAVIGAFGIDRVEDGQIEGSHEVLDILRHARVERDRAMARLSRSCSDPFRAADELMIRAIRYERTVLSTGRPVDMKTYEAISLDKQLVGVVAADGLAVVAGWTDRRRRSLRTALESIWLGLQIYDDVIDWADDLQRGGAWAVCLMRGLAPTDDVRADAVIGSRVLQSGVLRSMIARARAHMRRARRRASALGAHRLASWAAAQEERLNRLVQNEASSAGYALRATALAAWAREVLA